MEYAKILHRKIVEEIARREKDGFWYKGDKIHPLATAGTILLLHKEGLTKNHHKEALKKVAEITNDGESLRYVLRAFYEMGLSTEEVEKKLRKLYYNGMWRVIEGLPPDPLTTSAILVALHGTPILMEERRRAVERLKEEDRLPEEVEELAGGPRPVLLNLYRALALVLHGEVEEARRIWEKIKQLPLVDLPPKEYLERGLREDKYYPAVLAALLAKELGEDPSKHLEVLRDLDTVSEDTARLVTLGFYLGKLLDKL